MSQTVVNLGYVPKNRGQWSNSASYYKDNIVQYEGSSYICNPPGYDPDTNPTASVSGTAPYTTDPQTPNTGWEVFASDSAYAESLFKYQENPEFVRVYTDSENKILWAIKADGSIYYGAGVPQQVIDYIEEKISDISLDEYEDIVAFLNGLEKGDKTLQTLLNEKVDKEEGKSLIDAEYASSQSAIDNLEFLDVTLDAEGKILEGTKSNGKKVFPAGIEGIEEEIQETVEQVIETEFSNKSTTDKFSESGGRLLWDGNPIEADGVTQEELDQQLENYSTTRVADDKYASKSLEDTVRTLSDELESIDDEVRDINRDIDTINDGLSALTSPLPSGAIAGDNVWTGTNQFMQPIVGVSGTNDNNVALYGQFKNTLHRLVDAADYGFDTSKTGLENAQALQNAVLGGNKTVVISKPGDYLIGDTVLLDDNTTLICGAGVVLKKSSTSFVHILLNRGAALRTTNKNISIIGGTYSVNGKEALHNADLNTPLWGLRGLLAFLCIENLVIDGITISDLGVAQYAIHINSFNRFQVSNAIIKGNKDAIHFSDGEHFTIRHCYLDTEDDVVAMNSSDWVESNCVDGTIKYGLIEDCITKGAGRFLMNTGAIIDWYSGMEIYNGDRVVSNGNVYKAINVPSNTELQSETQPTIETFTGYQADEAGFKWKLMKKTPYYTTNVENIVIRNCHSYTTRILEGGSVIPVAGYTREIYPEVPIENYPHVDCVVEDCVFETTIIQYNLKVNDNIIIKNTKLPQASFGTLGKLEGIKGKTVLENCDYSSLSALPYDITTGYNVHLIIKGAKNTDCIRFDENLSRGRLETDYPCDATSILGKRKGDIIRVSDGTPRIYNGATWVDLV